MLAEAKKFAHLLHVCTVNDSVVYKVSLLLLRFLSQDVTVESVLSLNLTRSGKSESFFSTGISLYFWHFLLFLKRVIIIRRPSEIPNSARTLF